jgi:glycosyltransferase involved in cell wall biosynthesis
MKINALVSIVIPVYNGSNYLREAIDSALTQTYHNCEIVVVNDGSTDDTEKICLSYGDHIRYFSKKNGGVATALNFGIENMRGEYFSWLSHDDVYYPRKVEAQIEALRRNGDMRKIVIGDFNRLYQDRGEIVPVILKAVDDERYFTNSVYPVVKGLVGGCALLIHRSHFERVGVFDPDLRCAQDYDLWFKIFHKQKSVYVNELMYTLRDHSAQDEKTKISLFRREEIALWKGYTNKLTDKEMSEIYGSKFLFLLEMWGRMRLYDCNDNELYEKLRQDKKLRRVTKKLKADFNMICAGKDLPISVFGAGYWGLRIYHLLRLCDFDVNCFIDNNPQKHNTEIIDGVLCKSFEEMLNTRNNFLVIIAIQQNAGVLAQLNDAGFPYVITKSQIEKMLRDTK